MVSNFKLFNLKKCTFRNLLAPPWERLSKETLMRRELARFGTASLPVNVTRQGWLMASSLVAGLSGGIVTASQGIWAQAGPGAQAVFAGALLAAGTLVAAFAPQRAGKAMPGLLPRQTLVAEAESRAPGFAAVILCELTGLAWASRDARSEASDRAAEYAQQRLAALLPEGARATHWSEERFLVALPPGADAIATLELARELTMNLAAGPSFSGVAASVTCHAGIALAPNDGQRLCELVSSAELALAEARQQGKPGYGEPL